MDKNGNISCSIKSRHIVIKFFVLDDMAKQVNISVKHCPTEKMLSYFFTKPLQGSKFKFFRRVIMRWDDVATL